MARGKKGFVDFQNLVHERKHTVYHSLVQQNPRWEFIIYPRVHLREIFSGLGSMCW